MGFWARIARFFRALFGGAMSAVEEPEMILKQTIEDMRMKIPKMNSSLAKMKGGIKLLEGEIAQYDSEMKALRQTIKAALGQDDEGVAAGYALRLKAKIDATDRSKAQLEQTQKAYEQAFDLRGEYMRELEKKTREFKQAVGEKRFAEYKKDIASAFETFEAFDVDYTFDQMMDKMKQETAEADARLEVAMESTDAGDYKLRKKAEEIEAKEVLDQFKAEWGITSTPAADKTLGQTPEKEAE
ncbi:PspA/IM30 family protein [bacterium]|nr:PspA/IM30 family protein [bacterium]